MKTLRHLMCAALLLGCVAAPLPSFAAGTNADFRVDRLQQLVQLTPEQRSQALVIFADETAAMAKLRTAGQPAPGREISEINQASRDRVRALLSPAQQKIYDRASVSIGGGLTIPPPDLQVAQLEKTIPLTPAQRQLAVMIYQEELDSVAALPEEQRTSKGNVYRQTARNQIRDMLTPEQRSKFDDTQLAAQNERAQQMEAVESALRASPGVAARVGTIRRLQPVTSSTMTETKTGRTSGKMTYYVVGATGAVTITTTWEKPATDPIRVLGLATDAGEAVALSPAASTAVEKN